MSEYAEKSNFTPVPLDSSKRAWLITTSAVGAAGTVALAAPFAASFAPSEKARAAGAAVEVDISALKPGEKMTVAWRGKPVWILRRTPEQMDTLAGVDAKLADPKSEHQGGYPIPPYAQNRARAREEHEEILVLVGICTHLGCSPSDRFETGPQPSLPDDWPGGFFCACHGSTFDLSGRVYKDKPAPVNLQVPRYMFLSDTKLVIGQDEDGEGDPA